jgi:uncharacterized repeat protein (TIGR04138 family)
MVNQEFYTIIDQICEKDPRYKSEAYEFLMEALAFTQRKYKRSKHVSGEELLEGIKQILMQKFGPLTLLVLNHWGITKTEDFGNIVFNLVDNKVLSKDSEDNIDSFQNGYDFSEVFNQGYRKLLEKRISRMRA